MSVKTHIYICEYQLGDFHQLCPLVRIKCSGENIRVANMQTEISKTIYLFQRLHSGKISQMPEHWALICEEPEVEITRIFGVQNVIQLHQ